MTLRFSNLVVQPFIVNGESSDCHVDTLPINPFPHYTVQNGSMYYVDDCAPIFSAGEHCSVPSIRPRAPVCGSHVATGCLEPESVQDRG